jgi:hypothetical protein
MGMLQVGPAKYLASVWPGGAQQPLIVHTGYDVLELSVAVFRPHLGIEWLKAGRQNDCTHLDFQLLRLLIQIYGVILTYALANLTFLFFQVQTAFVNIGNKGYRLSEVYVDGLILGYFLVIFIRILDRAVFDTYCTTRALLLQDIPGFLRQRYGKVSCFPFDTVNFGIRKNFYVRMPADLDQFGCEYSH